LTPAVPGVPSGLYADVTTFGCHNVSHYTIGTDGSLTPMATATVESGSNPISVTTVGINQ
jgi:hypothetical protein